MVRVTHNKSFQRDQAAVSHLLQKAQKLRHENLAPEQGRYGASMSKAAIVAICFLASSSLRAQCLLESGIEEQFANADIVFLGRPTEILYTCNLNLAQSSSAESPHSECYGGNTVSRVEVLDIYKSSSAWAHERAKEYGVVLVADGSVHGLLVSTGNEYLVFAKQLSVDMYFSSACDGSTVTEIGGVEVSKLRELEEFLDSDNAP